MFQAKEQFLKILHNNNFHCITVYNINSRYRRIESYDSLFHDQIRGLSLKRGFGGLDEFSRFNRFGGLDGLDGWPRLSLKRFSVSFILVLKVLYLLLSYTLSYT